MKKFSKLGFSLIELSIVILIIGILVVGITKGSRIISEAKLKSARALTTSSPVASTDRLVMWLEATSQKSFDDSERIDTALGVQGTITHWYDINPQTTSGNDATQTGGVAFQPRYVVNGINGLPAVNFDGVLNPSSGDFMNFDGTPLVNSDYTIITVSSIFSLADITGSYRFFMGSAALDLAVVGYHTSTGYYALMQTAAGGQKSTFSTVTIVKPVVMSAIHSSVTGMQLYVNGSQVSTSASATTHLASFSGATLGKCAYFNGYFKGNLGEVIVFNKRLSDTERIAIENYLKAKWGIK